jgi:hypothetical protein
MNPRERSAHLTPKTSLLRLKPTAYLSKRISRGLDFLIFPENLFRLKTLVVNAFC